MRKIPKSEADIIKGPFKVKTRKQMDDELRDLMAEGGEVKEKKDSLPLERLKHHVSGAVERGEKTAIEAVVEQPKLKAKLSESDDMHPKSIVEAIRMRRAKRMAEGGQVDIDSNEIEDANMMDELNEAALDHDEDSTMDHMSQPEESNEHTQDIEDDRMDRIASIRRRLHKMR